MNKAIKEDFDYRKELKSWFELSIEKIWELIDRDSGNQNFWSIYSKENILDPYNDFDNETKEKAKKSNSKRKLVGLVSEESGVRAYYTKKNTMHTPDKLSLKKYDPVLRKHVVFTETKKNLGRNEVKEKKR